MPCSLPRAPTASHFAARGIGDFASLLILSVVIAALTGVIVGAFLVRYRAIFFAMLNLAVSMVFYSLFAKLYGITGDPTEWRCRS